LNLHFGRAGRNIEEVAAEGSKIIHIEVVFERLTLFGGIAVVLFGGSRGCPAGFAEKVLGKTVAVHRFSINIIEKRCYVKYMYNI
jgi:hypothetical protein